mmetsp:Transcript_11221/g.29160  ORF Transcript_11221/g.29160 Transcript_11221/m.29160 type:complete len:209 (-) Transcript_11221:742-1368(-)
MVRSDEAMRHVPPSAKVHLSEVSDAADTSFVWSATSAQAAVLDESWAPPVCPTWSATRASITSAARTPVHVSLAASLRERVMLCEMVCVAGSAAVKAVGVLPHAYATLSGRTLNDPVAVGVASVAEPRAVNSRVKALVKAAVLTSLSPVMLMTPLLAVDVESWSIRYPLDDADESPEAVSTTAEFFFRSNLTRPSAVAPVAAVKVWPS